MTTPSNDTEPAAPIDDRDLELMRFLDEELDEAEAEAFAAKLDDEVVRAKLAGLELVGELLRENAQADERADSIAAAVMERLEAQCSIRKDDDESSADVEPIASQPDLRPSATNDAPANDNSRSFFALAAMAAAVAAGLFLWGRSNPTAEVAQAPYDPPAVAAEMPTSIKPAAADTASLGEAEEEMGQVGMEIAAVDFGAQQGSVFYVGGSDEANATTVVWVTESGDEQ